MWQECNAQAMDVDGIDIYHLLNYDHEINFN